MRVDNIRRRGAVDCTMVSHARLVIASRDHDSGVRRWLFTTSLIANMATRLDTRAIGREVVDTKVRWTSLCVLVTYVPVNDDVSRRDHEHDSSMVFSNDDCLRDGRAG